MNFLLQKLLDNSEFGIGQKASIHADLAKIQLACAVPKPSFTSQGPTSIGLIRVKEEGWTGFSKSWQGCSEGFPEGKAQGKFHAAALLARGKPRPSRLFYSDLHSFFNSIDPPKMHRRFRIILPKMHRGFLIGPPESVLALLSPYWPS